MACKGCGLDHSPMLLCSVFKRQQDAINRTAINVNAINRSGRGSDAASSTGLGGLGDVPAAEDSADGRGAEVVVRIPRSANRRTKEAYNAYMREYMRKRRAK